MTEPNNAPMKGEDDAGAVVALLGKLAHRGAYLSFHVVENGEGRQAKVYSPQNGFSSPVLVIGCRVAEAATSQGLISPGCAIGRRRISLSGARLLKAFRSKGSGGACTSKHNGTDRAKVKVETRRIVECQLEKSSVRTVMVNEAESPLGWLRRRKGRDGLPMIDDAQFQAGERLRTDFERGQMTSRVTANWSATNSLRRGKRGGAGGAVELNENASAARQRVRRALEVVGPELSGVLIDVCCYLKGLEIAERGSGWPQRSGKVVLTLSLDALARHYGLISDDASRGKKYSRIVHWGECDYKPVMDRD